MVDCSFTLWLLLRLGKASFYSLDGQTVLAQNPSERTLLLDGLTVKLTAVGYFETSITVYHSTWRNTLADFSFP